jgi:N6-L-threonylcarbamoyladenine synthase/protein kinase Bud32
VRVLGIEGTAWAASAAVFETDAVDASERFGDPEADRIVVESDAYQPDSGGIHPREAAEHMGEAIPRVVESALTTARAWAREEADGNAHQPGDEHGDEGDPDPDPEPPIDAVAFSQVPGLGPCLRVVGTAARALAGALDVPLVGVNHMVAHLEVGRYFAGFSAPVCLNASGANAHLLGFHDGRYRVLGETMDTGVGNALDKFTRHVGWTHPGGPKLERAARDGSYVELPYVVKGMDFSFSGIMSAAKDRYDSGVPVADVARGLEETVFAMLTEVSERALSLTGAEELVLGGGVGQNDRLRGMLADMCAARGAAFYAPDAQYLRDNAGMIAILGARMYAAGDTVAIADSAVDPDFRPDQVPVTWRAGESVARGVADEDVVRGAEATVEIDRAAGRVHKRRVPKAYRHPELDDRLRRERTVAEARLLSEARRRGVPTPIVHDVDTHEGTLTVQYVGQADLATALTPARCRAVGAHLATLHAAGLVHGDPTTRNVRVAPTLSPVVPVADGPDAPGRVFLVDFGLGFHSGHVEDHAMDLHVFEQSLYGTADDPDRLVAAVEDGYRTAGVDGATGPADEPPQPTDDGAHGGARAGEWRPQAVLTRLRDVEGRGRYQ